MSAESRVRNPIDSFVLAKLESVGLEPASAADPRTLLRRMHLDLVGLPPTPEEVAGFAKAARRDRQGAVEQKITELLGSVRYGERWARHWLDVARYSDGFGGFLDRRNRELTQAWRYRDWVVSAFNDDLPYDRFVKLQISGDLVGETEDAVATGFFALGPYYTSDGGDPDSVAQARGETLGRPDRHSDPRLHGGHGFLRPLSRPQVRSHSPAGLLLPRRNLRQHREQ